MKDEKTNSSALKSAIQSHWEMVKSEERSMALIGGRSLSFIAITHALPKRTMEDYEQGRGDMTDK